MGNKNRLTSIAYAFASIAGVAKSELRKTNLSKDEEDQRRQRIESLARGLTVFFNNSTQRLVSAIDKAAKRYDGINFVVDSNSLYYGRAGLLRNAVDLTLDTEQLLTQDGRPQPNR